MTTIVITTCQSCERVSKRLEKTPSIASRCFSMKPFTSISVKTFLSQIYPASRETRAQTSTKTARGTRTCLGRAKKKMGRKHAMRSPVISIRVAASSTTPRSGTTTIESTELLSCFKAARRSSSRVTSSWDLSLTCCAIGTCRLTRYASSNGSRATTASRT